jgi:peptidoglycan hydrolase-like protein with peptidoglycan-binding domain
MRPQRARVGTSAAICVAATLLLAACGGDDDDSPAEPAGTKLWFTAGEQFEPVDADTPDAGPKTAVKELLEGPARKQSATGKVPVETSIPGGSSLEQLDVGEDGTAVVKLSPEFAEGVSPDPARRDRDQQADLDARVAQLTYTLTQFEGIKEARVVSGDTVVEPKVDRKELAAPAAGPKPVERARGPKLPGTRQVQKRLAKLGYLPKDAVDGVAGYWTEQAVMAFQAWEGLDRDGDVGPMTAEALKDARRPKPRRGGPAKRIEVYRDKGVALLVDGGRTKRAIHVSAGAPGTETPLGRYEVFRKELQSWSVPFQTWLPYASYFNNGIAFHEYPDVPPFPASHGCVRVPSPEAKGVYRFAAIGTAVHVY